MLNIVCLNSGDKPCKSELRSCLILFVSKTVAPSIFLRIDLSQTSILSRGIMMLRHGGGCPSSICCNRLCNSANFLSDRSRLGPSPRPSDTPRFVNHQIVRLHCSRALQFYQIVLHLETNAQLHSKGMKVLQARVDAPASFAPSLAASAVTPPVFNFVIVRTVGKRCRRPVRQPLPRGQEPGLRDH